MKKILVAKPENVCETKNCSRLEEIILKILITGILADFQETPKITTNEKFPTLSFKLWKHLFSQQSPLKTLVSSHVFSGRKRHMEGKSVCGDVTRFFQNEQRKRVHSRDTTMISGSTADVYKVPFGALDPLLLSLLAISLSYSTFNA